MSQHHRIRTSLAVVAALALLSAASAAQAASPRTPAQTVSLRSRMAANCCPAPCVVYRGNFCGPTVHTVLCVKDPCTCCVYKIPVCLPKCCTGDPSVCGRCGLFGRGIVNYDWCCGASITVTFRARGDVVVAYRG